MRKDEAERISECLTSIPAPQQERYLCYVEEILQIPFFQQKGRIDPRWRVSFGPDLASAATNAIVDSFRISDSLCYRKDGEGMAAITAAAEAAFADGRRIDELNAVVRRITMRLAIGAARHAGVPEKMLTDLGLNAAFSAQMVSSFIIAEGIAFPDRFLHESHAEARFEVIRRGFGLSCDINGELYVFAVDTTGALRREAEDKSHVFRYRDVAGKKVSVPIINLPIPDPRVEFR
jgi:hypothetical protein